MSLVLPCATHFSSAHTHCIVHIILAIGHELLPGFGTSHADYTCLQAGRQAVPERHHMGKTHGLCQPFLIS